MALISIIVPVYHNAASLPDMLKRLAGLAEGSSGDSFEFIFVDDGSQDNSFAVLEELAAQDSRIRVVKLTRNFGVNAVLLSGLSQARGQAIGAIAADLQDPPELLKDMLSHWREGYKVVLAAREERDDPALTIFFADLFYALFRRFVLKTMPRRGYDFFMIDRQVADIISQIQENNAYLMGLILWLGFTPYVVYYHRQAREKRYGRSMWTFTRKLKYFVDTFVGFSHVPLRLASIIGIGLSFLGLIYALIIIFSHTFFGQVPEGWSSLMVVLLIVSGAQMFMLGILGEYMWRNLDETRRRPRFVIDRIVEPPPAEEKPAPEEKTAQ